MSYYRGFNMKRTTMSARSGVVGLAVSAAVLFASGAYAQNLNLDSLNGPQSVSGTGNDQNVTGNGSTGIYNNAAATGGSVKNSGNSQNKNTNTNLSNSSSKSNAIAGAAASGNSANNLTINSDTPSTQTVKNVPTVYAPGLSAAGTEVCLGSLSAGGAAAGFGLTLGGTMVDRECQLRLNAKTLAVLGYTVAAREEMCLDPEVRSAMLAAGTPCTADKGAPPQARADYGASVAPAVNISTVAASPAPQASAPAAAPMPINLSTVAASPAPQASAPAAPPGCHKAYQLFGGWYDVCPSVGQAVYASADNLPVEAAVPAQEAAAPGCRKEYQLIGGWYEKCD